MPAIPRSLSENYTKVWEVQRDACRAMQGIESYQLADILHLHTRKLGLQTSNKIPANFEHFNYRTVTV